VEDKARVFVGGIPKTIGAAEVEDLFRQFGSIRDVWVVPNRLVGKEGQNRGFCFVSFAEELSAREAIQASLRGELVMEGRPVRVDWAHERPLDNG